MVVPTGSGGGQSSTGYKFWNTPPPAPRIGVASQSALNKDPAYQYATQVAGRTNGPTGGLNNAALDAIRMGLAGAGSGGVGATRAPTPKKVNLGGGSSGRSGGGGGGGGGGGVAGMTQAQLDWAAQLLGASAPRATSATTLDLPEFQGQFDPSYYNTMRGSWNQALDQSRGVGNQATQNLTNYLTSNYTNAFNNPNAQYATAGQAPGMDQQAMARMLQSQGVDPSINQANVQGAAAADQGFGNLWRTLAANEDRNQQNSLTNAQIMNQDVQNRINAIGLAGTTGIGLQEGQARSAYDQAMQERNWQTAQQEAMANWERANQVTDTNATNTNAYRNSQLQALLGLLPSLQGTNLTLPTLQALGLG